MKKFLKNVICGTREQCTDALFTVNKSTIAGWKKKKKKKKVEQKRKRQNQCNWNGYIINACYVRLYFLLKKSYISPKLIELKMVDNYVNNIKGDV